MTASRAALPGKRSRRVGLRARLAGRTWLVWVAAAALVVLAIAVSSTVQLLRAEHKLKRARTALLAAEADAKSGVVGRARTRLASAEADISSATLILHNDPTLTLAGGIPVVHQNLVSLRRSVALVLEMADGGQRILDSVKPLEDATGRVNVPLRGGAVPLDVVARLRDELGDFTSSLPGPSEAPGRGLLVGPVAKLQRQVYSEAARRRHEFASTAGALGLLSDMAGANGPRHYLLAVANAAEMRATGGMVLSFGVLSSADGKFTLDRFGPINDIALTQPAQPNPVPDYVNRFSEFSPTLFWRNANLTGDYHEVGPVMAEMYKTATGNAVDGVIQVDSMGLSALLRGVGPVTVPDLGEVNADNAVALTLNEAYTRFPDRPIRQEYLGQVAEAAFRRLVTGDYPSLKALARSLTDAANHRDVIFWSSRPAGERPAIQLGADGSLPDAPDFADLTVQNLTGNKLDYYLDTALRLTGRRQAGALGHLTAQITIRNTASRDGRPAYVFGPAFPDFQPGEYDGLVNLYLPQGASVTGSSGLDKPDSLALQGETGRTIVSFRTVLQAGESRTFTIELRLPPGPPGPYHLDLVPVPRVRPTAVDVDIDVGGRRVRHSGPLLGPTSLR